MWSEGEVIVRREVLNDGRAWLEVPVVVVRDEPELLATYVAEGTPFHFPGGRLADAERATSVARAHRLAGPRRADAAAAGRGARDLGLLARARA